MILLLALAATVGGAPAPLPKPPPPSCAVPVPWHCDPKPHAAPPAPRAATALLGAAGGQVTSGPVACDQPLGCGTTTEGVEVDTHDGFEASTSPAWDRGAVTTAPDYSARLDAQLCAVKPVFCS